MHVCLATGRTQTRATCDALRFEQICALSVTFVMAAVQGVIVNAIIMASMAGKGLRVELSYEPSRVHSCIGMAQMSSVFNVPQESRAVFKPL